MKYSTKELNIYYAKVFLDTFDSEESIEECRNEAEKFRFVNDRFHVEYQHVISKLGKQAAFREWLQGLALSIPCTNNDILDLAKETGHLIDNPNNEYRILSNYFNFMACKFFWLLQRKQSWFDINLKNA